MKELSHEELGKEKGEIVLCLLKEKICRDKILDFEIAGNSMSPFLKQGDTILAKAAKFRDLQKGDLIIYRLNQNLCVHRYIYPLKSSLSNKVHKLKGGGNSLTLIAKGDNVNHFDRLPIPIEHLIGKVISIRKNKKIINLERTSWRIINHLLASISATQAYVSIFLAFLRKTFLQNRKFRLGLYIREWLCFIFSIPLKLIVYITQKVSLF